MKKFLFLSLIFLGLLSISCSKDNKEEDTPSSLDTSTFVGKWVSYDTVEKSEEGSPHEATNRYSFQFTGSKAKLVLMAESGGYEDVEEYILDYTQKDNSTIAFDFTDKRGQRVIVAAKLTNGMLYVGETRQYWDWEMWYYCNKKSDVPDKF